MGSPAGQKRLELTLLEELASGTFARVYLAEARASGGVDRLVAVKVLREKWAESDEVLTRTRDEARLLARLRHKHIVRVEELSELDGQPAIIMEYVEGMDLQQILDRLRAQAGRFPPRAALQIGVATASALDAAYRRVPYGQAEPLRVVHRDVKPSNVMISIDGEIKVLDFGTARATSPLRAAQTGLVRFGSWKYMSPERKEGDRGDHASDIYSLGLLLVELLGSEWIQGLAVSPAEHDAKLRDIVDSIADLGMPNEAWNAALRDLLLQMSAFSADVRPSAQQLVEVLRQYADQARGQTVDLLAAEVIQGALRAQRQQRTEGALTGTRLYVSLDGASPPHAHRAEAEDAPLPDDPAYVPTPSARPEIRSSPAADEFDEPATVVEPFPSPGHYAMGAAQIRFGVAPEPAPARPAPAQPVQAQPAPDPAATWGIAASPAPQPAAGGWRPEPPTEPTPLPDFQPVGVSQVETEFLPAPDPAEFGTGPAPGAPGAPGAPIVKFGQPTPGYGPPVESPRAPAPAARYTPPTPAQHQPYVAAPAHQAAPSPWATGPVAGGPVMGGPVMGGPVMGGPVMGGPVYAGPIASGPVPPGPTVGPTHPGSPAPGARPRAGATPRRKPKKSRLPLILGGLVLLFLLCAGVVPLGYFGYGFLRAYLANRAVPAMAEPAKVPAVPVEVPSEPVAPDASPSTPPDTPPTAPTDAGSPGPTPPGPTEPSEPSAPAARGAALTIQAADRAIRKIELLSPDGAPLMESKGSLEGEFPPGPYRLVVKVAGRDPVGDDFTLAETGLQVACAPDEKMEKVLCKNPEGAISLVLVPLP